MSRFIVPLGAFALLVIVLAIGIHRSGEKSIIASPLIGRSAPAFALPSLTDPGRTIRSEDLRGQAYLLNVWGTWCVACREEHEMLLAIKRAGLVPLIGLNWKDEDAAALEWLAKLGNPYETILVDRIGRTAIDWGVYGAPETFLVSPSGIVIYKYVGPLTPEIWRKEIIPRLPGRT